MFLRYAITETINGSNNFCSLCFKPATDAVIVEDKIQILDCDTENREEQIDCLAILRILLGDEIANNFSPDNSICIKCRSTMTDCYKFIGRCRERRKLFSNTIESINNCLGQCEPKSHECKSIFVTWQLEDVQVYYNYSTDDNESKASKLKALINSNKKNCNTDLEITLSKRDNVLCELCHKIFVNSYKLSVHYTRIHAPKVYKCSKCPKSYGSQYWRGHHEDNAHTLLVCSICGKPVKKHHIQKHRKIMHSTTTKIVCQFCGKLFKGNHTFKHHKCVKLSDSQKYFECDYCHKKLLSKTTLKLHIDLRHLNIRDYSCIVCNKSYCNAVRLRKHMTTHNGTVFTCEYCGVQFNSSNGLLYHKRSHSGEKPFKCSECDCSFISGSRRADHVKSKHREPQFTCMFCNAKFKYKYLLTNHILNYHASENSVTAQDTT